MYQLPRDDESPRESLSALADGELPVEHVREACTFWKDDATGRSTWHAYHLIGDVLRSEDLASTPAADERFLFALRARLAAEPVVLVPQPLQRSVEQLPGQRPARVRSWVASAAAVAGISAVVGVVAVTDPFGSRNIGSPLVAQGAPALGVRAVSAADNSGEPVSVMLNGRLIRDARLDAYLAAHKKFGGSSAPGVPSGFLRNATASDDASR